ncbi:hypothetical protein STEG23_031942 [Scotinomys teguina]
MKLFRKTVMIDALCIHCSDPLQAFLGKLTKEKNEIPDKINKRLASQNMVKENNELNDKIAQLQIFINSLQFSNGALEETLLFSSQKAKM